MGKSIYLSTKEAEWILNCVTYHDAPIDDEGEQAKVSIRKKVAPILGKSNVREEAQ